MRSFERVILYARQHRANSGVYETVHRLLEHWKNEKDLQVLLECETAKHCEVVCGLYPTVNLETCLQTALDKSLLIVIGGDGSLLGAARLAVLKNLPIVGVNRGRLGFLTSINPEDAPEKLDEVLKGQYSQEYRFLLHARVNSLSHSPFPLRHSRPPLRHSRAGGNPDSTEANQESFTYTACALNDIVIKQDENPAMIEFEVYQENALICHYRADGFIVATPTGSTAYALSGGGPILHPNLETITLVPMFPQSLSSRPIVLEASKPIRIVYSKHNEGQIQVMFDGQDSCQLSPGDTIEIEQFPQKLSLLHPLDYNYYETLRSKLGWEVRPF